MPDLRSCVNEIARSQSLCRLRLAALLFGVWLAIPELAVGATTFTATLDRDSIPVGESATLTLKFESDNSQIQPKILGFPPIANLQMQRSGNASSSFTVVNGQVSGIISQDFLLTPTQPGEYVIPAIQAEVEGQALTSKPLRLKATKEVASTGSTNGELGFLRVILPKKEAYVGEVIPIEFQVFVREGVVNGGYLLQQFDNYGGCPLKGEGFSFLKTAHVAQRRARVGNFNYTVGSLVSAVSPVKAGTLSVGSMEVTFDFQTLSANQQNRGFDPWGMLRSYDTKRLNLSAEPQTLTALPLPRTNVPPFFTGAVGSYTMTVTAGPTNVAAGDPVTVKVQISGRGAFDSLSLPDQTSWTDFKTYPPTSKVDTTDSLGLEGTKVFEEVVVPQSMDIKQVPPVTFSYFNPEKKAYQTLTSRAVPLIVRPGGTSVTPSVVVSNQRAPDNPPVSADIIHIKPRMGAIAQINKPLLQQPWFVVLQVIPIGLWLSALFWRRKTDNLANNPRLRRQLFVAQLVRNGLVELRSEAAANNSDAFFATVVRLVQEQLGERLDVPASAITEAVIDERLRPRGVSESVLTPLHEIFQLCNLARYAPIKTSQELNAIIPKVESVLRGLQEVKL